MTRRNIHSWHVVTLPERDLAELVLEFAAPLLEGLGQAPAIDDTRAALALAIRFWNASVLASKVWPHPRAKELRDLKKLMSGRGSSSEDAAKFELLSKRWREYWLDPRLVASWSYEFDAEGIPRLECAMELPDGVKLHVPPDAEKRVAIGGRFLDEVKIAMSATTSLGFPVERHRAVVGTDGTAVVYAMMPAALKLFADGTLPRIGGEPVALVIGGRNLPSMRLTEVRCGGDHSHDDTAVLVFVPTD